MIFHYYRKRKNLTFISILIIVVYELSYYAKFKKETSIETLIEWNDEWESLGQTCFIRRNSSFYFSNENKIRVLAIAKLEVFKNLRYYVTITDRKQIKNTIELDFRLDKFLKYKNYYSAAIDCFSENLIFSKETISMQLEIFDRKTGARTARPIEVKIKIPNPNPNNIVICTKFFNFTSSGFEMFQKWVEINKKLGYNKIVLYNHSISTQPYKQFIDSQNGFVELRPYKYLSHLDIERNLTGLNFEDLHSLKYAIFDVTNLHERIALNDCFLSSLYDYKRVAVFDIDEIIYPKINNLIGYESFTSTSLRKVEPCSYNIVSYLDNLIKDYVKSKSFYSLWFRYAHALTKSDSKLIFGSLKSKMESKFTEPFQVDMLLVCDEYNSKNITIQVNTTEDYEYAKKLLTFYEDYVMGKKVESIFSKPVDDIFNRVFSIVGSSFLNNGFGKSIHETNETIQIGHHESFNITERIELDLSIGYVTHFRRCLFYNNTNRVLNVKQIHVDLTYLDCS